MQGLTRRGIRIIAGLICLVFFLGTEAMGVSQPAERDVSISGTHVRQPTLEDTEEDRIHADETTLKLIQSGKVKADPKPVILDLRALKAQMNQRQSGTTFKAASLGGITGLIRTPGEEPEYYRESVLMPPRTEEEARKLADYRNMEIFRIEPDGKLRLGRDETVAPFREELLDPNTGNLTRKREVIWQFIQDLNKKDPGITEGITFSFRAVPDKAVVLREAEGGRNVLEIDYRLFADNNLAAAGIVEVLYGFHLRESGNSAGVKMYALLLGLRYLLHTDRTRLGWLSDRWKEKERFKMLAFLQKYGDKPDLFQLKLENDEQLSLMVDLWKEGCWLQGKSYIETMRRRGAETLNQRIDGAKNFRPMKGTAAAIEIQKRQDGLLDKEFFKQFQPFQIAKAMVYFIKTGKMNLFTEILKIIDDPKFNVHVINSLFVAKREYINLAMSFEKEELVDLLINFSKQGLMLEISGKQMSVKEFMRDAHYKGYLAHYVWDEVNEIFERKIRAQGSNGDNPSEKPAPVTPSSQADPRVQEPLKEMDEEVPAVPEYVPPALVISGEGEPRSSGMPVNVSGMVSKIYAKLEKGESPASLAGELAGIVQENPSLREAVTQHVNQFTRNGLDGVPIAKLRQVQEEFLRLIRGSSLGVEDSGQNERIRTLLIPLSPGDDSKGILNEAGRFLSETKNTAVTFLAAGSTEEKELEHNPLYIDVSHRFGGRVQIEKNKLISANDFENLKEFVKNRSRESQTDFAFIAPLGTLEKVAALEGMIKLASDKVQGKNGARLGNISELGYGAGREKVFSALFDTAWQALSAGSGNVEFLNRTRQLGRTRIYVITSEYLAEWLEHLFAEHSYAELSSSSA